MPRVEERTLEPGKLQYAVSGDRPAWSAESKRQLAADFLKSDLAATPVGDLIDRETGNIDSFHRRHIISWDRIKTIVVVLVNAEGGRGFEFLRSFTDTLGVMRPSDFDREFAGLFDATGKLQSGFGDKIKELLKCLYNSSNNTFIGFASENTSRGALLDDPRQYAFNAEILSRIEGEYRAVSRALGVAWSVEERVPIDM